MERPQNSFRNRRTSLGFGRVAVARGASSDFLWLWAGGGTGAWSILRILFGIEVLLWFWAGGGAGAWSVLRILFGIDILLVVLGGWRRWHSECPENSVLNGRPSRGFERVRRWRAEQEVCSESTTFSWFWAGGGAGAWTVLRILFGIDDLLMVLGGWWRWRVELRILF